MDIFSIDFNMAFPVINEFMFHSTWKIINGAFIHVLTWNYTLKNKNKLFPSFTS